MSRLGCRINGLEASGFRVNKGLGCSLGFRVNTYD